MSYIIKASFSDGTISWLSARDNDGTCEFGSREAAAVFASINAAQVAIAKMPVDFTDDSVIFDVEPAR